MAFANINFKKILVSTRRPGAYTERDAKLTIRNPPTNKQRVLIVAQHNNPALGELTEPENVFPIADTAAKYSAGNMVRLMVIAAIKVYAYANLSLTTIVDDRAGVTVADKITLNDTANTQGMLRVSIASADTLTIGISAEDTAATIATAARAAIDAIPDLPVTATVVETVVTLTVKNKGMTDNAIRTKTNNIAEDITAAVTATTGGDASPDIAAASNVAVVKGHRIVVCGINDETNLLKLHAHLDTVTSPMEKRQAIGVYGQTDTLAQATILAGRLSHGHIASAWYRDTLSLPCELAAALATVMASEEDPTRPLNALALNSIGVCESKDRIMRTKQENALYNGATPTEASPAGMQAQVVCAITTYTRTANGTTDESLLDVTTVHTPIYVSRAYVDRIALRFPHGELSDRTPLRVHSELVDALMRCEKLEVLERVEGNLPKPVVERDLQNTDVSNCRIPSNVVNDLHIVGMVVDLYL